ncbi:MAG: Gfo/Idh/MocA family oxidoreductase [Paenibacillus sp.]|nr:Gfo/Idh/MocA family oxidoreductase [Paenibacillus sp.]
MPYRTVIIGAGSMGRRQIATVNNAEGFDLCGISDLLPAALDLARQAGAPQDCCFTDTELMLDKLQPECAIVSTTADSHFTLAKLAVEKGVRLLLVEKPLCTSIKQAVDLQKLCREAGVRLAVNHSVRFDRYYQQAIALARGKGMGPITGMTLVGGNMGIAMNVSHMLEFFRLLTGNPVRYVRCWMQDDPTPNPRGAKFHDGAGLVMAKNESGQRFYADVSPDQGHGMRIIISTRFAQLDFDVFIRKAIVSKRKTDQLNNPLTRYSSPFEVYEYELEASPDTWVRSLEALGTGIDYPDGEVGERIVRSLVALWISHESDNAVVDVNGSLPEERKFAWA